MADEKSKTVKVTALQAHTAFGKAYEIGDTYDIDEAFADTVVTQGKAVRADDAAAAHKVAAAKGTAVPPMTTDDVPHAKPKK
jgi:hypothetical protein